MRRIILAVALASLWSLPGCKPPPKEQSIKGFHKSLHLYFNNLNTDAEGRRDRLLAETKAFDRNPIAPRPTGTAFSTFTFDEEGYILENVVCKNPNCKARYTLIDYYGTQVNCGACGWGEPPAKATMSTELVAKLGLPKTEPLLAAKMKPDALDLLTKDNVTVHKMFEQPPGTSNKLPMKATIRYIRRSWSYDPRGQLEGPITGIGSQPSAADSSGTISASPRVQVGGPGELPGFHRLDEMFVGEQEFEFNGTDVKALGAPVEKPIRTWAGLRTIPAEPKKINQK